MESEEGAGHTNGKTKEESEDSSRKINGKSVPKSWGDIPPMQTRDYRTLPAGYGMGSGTLAKWIQKNLDADNSSSGADL